MKNQRALTNVQPIVNYLTNTITPEELARRLDLIAQDYALFSILHPMHPPDTHADRLNELFALKECLQQCS